MRSWYLKHYKIKQFAISEIVTIKLLRGTRTSTNNRKLFARVVSISYQNWYNMQTKYGIIDRLFTTRSLSRVLLVLANTLNYNKLLYRIPLSRAAIKALALERVIISYKYKNIYNTRRCRCFFKEGNAVQSIATMILSMIIASLLVQVTVQKQH